MSRLPERRRSPQEIAHLRDTLGVPGATGRARTPPSEERPPPAAPASPPGSGASPARGSKPVRSLRRSERMTPPAKAAELSPRPGVRHRGLGAPLPAVRHSAEELAAIRMRNAIETKPPVEWIAAQAAHPLLLGLGYLLALAGGVGGIGVAAFLWVRKPRSHHHAAFMAIIAVLVIAFGIVYALPHLLPYFLPKPDAA